MTVADFEYIQLLGNAKCVGLGYGILPMHERSKNLPFVCLICEQPSHAAKAFEHFKDWITRANGRNEALQVSLIRLNTDGYKICIYPAEGMLQERCFPSWMADDVETVFLIASYIKGFDSHGAYEPLKEMAKAGPILFCYGDYRTGEPIFKEGILLNNMKFILQSEVQPNSIEMGAVREPNTDNEQKPQVKRRHYSLEDITKIKKRRLVRLKSHFPVTLEYLGINPGFLIITDTLNKESYTDWQIKQAACNIILSLNLTGTPTFENIDLEKFYSLIAEYFSTKRESPLKACPSPQCFNLSIIRNQIICDQKKLLEHFLDNAQTMKSNELQIEMSKLGLL